MEVILQADFPSLGYVGDRVNVRPGYARNYLVPRGIAVEASSRNAKLLQHRMAGIQAKRAKLKGEAVEFGKRFEGLVLEFTLKAGEGGKSFGSITTKDIDAALKKHGIEVERKQIRLFESVRQSGEYKAEIKLHAEVSAALTIRVTQERAVESGAAAEEGGRKTGKRRRAKAADDSADTAELEAEESKPDETEEE